MNVLQQHVLDINCNKKFNFFLVPRKDGNNPIPFAKEMEEAWTKEECFPQLFEDVQENDSLTSQIKTIALDLTKYKSEDRLSLQTTIQKCTEIYSKSNTNNTT